MDEIAIYKRIMFDNIVLKLDNYWLLMNLYSFRRKYIKGEELEELKQTYERIKFGEKISEEDRVYNQLKKEKQILDKSVIEKIDMIRRMEKKYELGPIREAMINLSYRCNLNCGYCYQKNFKSNDEVMRTEDVFKIKKFIDKFNNQNDYLEEITISGGEPLLEENIDVIINILEIFNNKKINLFTNGINIIKYSKVISFEKFREIQISLDGNDLVISRLSNIIENGYFAKIIAGIHYLFKIGCRIKIVCMFSCGITDWIESFLEELFVNDILIEIDEIRISIPTDYKNNHIINKDYFSINEYLLLKNIIKNSNYRNKVNVDTLMGFARIQEIIKRPINERYYGKTSICRSNEKMPITFGPNGKIYWCICMEFEKGIIGNYYANNINKSVINDYIIRDIFNIRECKECNMRYLCASGCPTQKNMDEKILSPACNAYNDEFLVDNLEVFIL